MSQSGKNREPLSKSNPELCKEWDYLKNGDLKPDSVTAGSGLKIWWRCSEGHSWQASIGNRSKGTGCPYCSGQKKIVGLNDFATKYPLLAKEWNYTKNEGLKPSDVSPFSSKRVWWLCSKGHEWQTSISNRSRGHGCPFCAREENAAKRSKPILGVNDLASQKPDILKEWDSEKNKPLTPNDYSVYSNKSVWWKCNNGHHYQSRISSRTLDNYGCPYCSGKKVLAGYNDLATAFPNLVKEWDYDRNNPLLPDGVTVGSNIIVWWKCDLGHHYRSKICIRTSGSGCPYCSGQKILEGFNDLATLYPEIAKEWDNNKNGDLKPSQVSPGSGKKVWWVCSVCGNSWSTQISNRTKGHSCAKCGFKKISTTKSKPVQGVNDLATLNPDLIKEWDYDKNGDLKPTDVFVNSNKIVWWKCSYGHSWKTSVGLRNGQDTQCPLCRKSGTSLPEQGIVFYLSKITKVQSRVKMYKKEIDVFLPEYNVGIEYDGIFYHKNKKLLDNKKEQTLLSHGIVMVRIIESDEQKEENNHIYFIHNTSGNNYEQVLKKLCQRLASITNNDSFLNIDIDFKRDRIKIREQVDLYQKDNSFAIKYPSIAQEWDYAKNGILKPEMFFANSGEKVWWKCSKGHSWQAVIASRSRGRGCPYCSGNFVQTGVNDLATIRPDLLLEWDYDKNGDLKPTDLAVKSDKKVWWRCSICNGSWKTTISHRSNGQGCPYCKGKAVLKGFNDLVTVNPELAKEWDYDKNGCLVPAEVTAMSRKNVWWKCLKGHSWQACVYNRTLGRGCPYCANKKVLVGYNDLLNLRPDLIVEWDYEKNDNLSPTEVTPGSMKKVWWKCSKCANSWQTSIRNRTRLNTGCPECMKDAMSKAVICDETNVRYASAKSAQEQTGIKRSLITACCRGECETAGGYHWRYVEE